MLPAEAFGGDGPCLTLWALEHRFNRTPHPRTRTATNGCSACAIQSIHNMNGACPLFQYRLHQWREFRVLRATITKDQMKSSFVISLVIVAAFITASAQERDEPILRWIREHCIAVPSPWNQTGDGYFPFLSQIPEQTRILSIGEVSHGIGDFAAIKFKIFGDVASAHGYSVFAIEDDFFKVEALNKYVITGEGDPRELLKPLIRSYANEETLAMIQWMRSYNATLKTPERMLKIYGFDSQNPAAVIEALKEKYKSNHKIYTILDTISLERQHRYFSPTLSGSDLKQVSDRIETSQEFLETTHSGLSVSQLIILLRHSNEVAGGNPINRDEYMAELLAWILELEGEGAKAIVSAHNFHVMYSTITNRNGDALNHTMGTHLRKRFKDRVFTIGIDFNKGSFWAADLSSGSKVIDRFTLPDAPDNTFSSTFSRVGIKLFYLDLGKVRSDAQALQWFAIPRGNRNITAVFNSEMSNEDAIGRGRMLDVYDAILFFDEVREARLLKKL